MTNSKPRRGARSFVKGFTPSGDETVMMHRGLNKARLPVRPAQLADELPLFLPHYSVNAETDEVCREAIAAGLDLDPYESEALQALHSLLWKAYKPEHLEAQDYSNDFAFTEAEFLEACGLERRGKGDFKSEVAARYIKALKSLDTARVFPMYYSPKSRAVIKARIVNLRSVEKETYEAKGWRANATAYRATITQEILKKIADYYVRWNPRLERCMRDGSTRPARIVPRLAALIHDCVSGSIEMTAGELLQRCGVQDCQSNNLRRLRENLDRAAAGGFIRLEERGGRGRSQRYRITPIDAEFPSRIAKRREAITA